MVVVLCVGLGIVAVIESWIHSGPRRRLALAALALAGAGLIGSAALGGFGAQKVVGRLVMPAGVLWIALFARAVYAARLARFAEASVSSGLFLAYTLSGSVFLGNGLVVALEAQVPPTAPAESDLPFDAVFVLGGGTKLDPDGAPQLSHSGDRLRRAAALWHAGETRHLVASGFSPPPMGDGDLSWATALLWRDMGVSSKAVLYLNKPVNTAQEIAAYRALADEEGWTKMGLVSSAWHLPRALALAERAGLDVVPLASDHRGDLRLTWDTLWLVPQPGGFELVGLWAWEVVGRAVGR